MTGLLRPASALALALLASLGLATTYRFMTPVELLGEADVVFTARVVDVSAAVDADKAYEEVYTTVTFAVEEVLRGYGVRPRPGQAPPAENGEPDAADPDGDPDELAGPPQTIELDFLGGEAAGDRSLLVAGSPTWRTGEDVLVAAYLDPDLASPLTGFRQGLWRLGGDGYQDLDGRSLGLDANGRLVRTDLPGAQAEVLEAVRALLSGEAPAPAAADQPPEAEGLPGAPADEEPADDEPAEEEPAGDEPADEEPAEDEPAADEPAADEPAADEPAADEPAGDEPADEAGPIEPVTATYSVDDAGGPLLLSDAVAGAAVAWRELAPGVVELSAAASAPYTFSYAQAALFSDETLSLTLVRPGAGARSGTVSALLSPDVGGQLERVLHHELGLLLGLPAGAQGVMAMAVRGAEAVPGEAELAELSAVNRFAAGDLSRDGVVDFNDLLEFALAYGRSGLNLPADLDGDGDVDDDDLTLLRDGYRLTPPSRP